LEISGLPCDLKKNGEMRQEEILLVLFDLLQQGMDFIRELNDCGIGHSGIKMKKKMENQRRRKKDFGRLVLENL
jgi:hypothetical protein